VAQKAEQCVCAKVLKCDLTSDTVAEGQQEMRPKEQESSCAAYSPQFIMSPLYTQSKETFCVCRQQVNLLSQDSPSSTSAAAVCRTT
jgi:hypothetical protein